MNEKWKQFLLSNNASINDNWVNNFGLSIEEEQAAYSNVIITDLSHYGLIEASGDDVVEFLQGQLTNDIKSVADGMGQLSAYCNPKGRLLANFRVFMREDHYFLRLRCDILDSTIKRLRMFVMRSKVELHDSSESLISIGIAGRHAARKLSSQFSTLPVKADEFYTENDITLIKLPGDMPQYEAYAPLNRMIVLWQALQADAVAVSHNSWNLLTIRAGIPEIVSQTVETFVPQMLNLQAINGLSFTKGCYPGQEVVARMHYLGKLKRRLYLGSVQSQILPLPAQSIMTEDDSDQKAGQIVNACWAGNGKADILAVLQIDKADQGDLHIATSNGPVIKLAALPYSLDD